MTERTLPAPTPTPETEAFWAATREGKFLVKTCKECQRAHWYPRALCPFCFADATEWREASGNGRIYSFSIMRRAPQPYAIAYVALEEGPMMMTNIVGCDFDEIAIGQAVRVELREAEGGFRVPVFTPG